jgi:hypothetical protein
MRIRKYKPEDAAAIDEIYERCHLGTFSRPDLSLVIGAAVVENEDGKIIGFGCLEIILEATMIMDTDIAVKERIDALRALIETGQFAALSKKFERFYVFPSDLHFAEILRKHFKFNNCAPIMCCELGDKNG